MLSSQPFVWMWAVLGYCHTAQARQYASAHYATAKVVVPSLFYPYNAYSQPPPAYAYNRTQPPVSHLQGRVIRLPRPHYYKPQNGHHRCSKFTAYYTLKLLYWTSYNNCYVMFRKYLSLIFNVYHNETCKSSNKCSIFTALITASLLFKFVK